MWFIDNLLQRNRRSKMKNLNLKRRLNLRYTGAAIFAAALVTSSGVAFAGECPAGKTGVDVTKPAPAQASGVTDTVLSAIDLADTPASLKGYKMRLRRLVVEPGGVVAWHSHAERPSNIYIIEGSITEYRSTCSVPIEHKAGDAVAEVGGLQHWWRNNTDKPTVLTSSDLFHEKMADEHMM
jgi:quercetin dioxygenase-like cupin family protein